MKGYIEERSPGTWRIHVHLGYDQAGTRRRKVVTVKGTKKDAEKKLAELVHAAHQGTLTPPTSHTVESYLAYWLEHFARHKSARTYENYSEYCRNYLVPGLGSIPLDRLRPADIQGLYTRLLVSGGTKHGQGLSSTTVANAHRVFKGALRRAVQWQIIAKNPAEAVTPPSPAERPPKVLSAEQVAQVLDAATPHLYRAVLIAACCGLRRGELCGLRWGDVNFKRSLISVQQTLVRVRPGTYEFKAPKTRAGKRTVVMPQILAQALTAAREDLEETRERLGTSYNPQDLVICRPDGRPVDPATLYSTFQKLLVRLNLPRVAIHDLRHSHATMLLEAGVHPKVVADRLGHEDPSITLRVYSHVSESIQREAADRTDDVFRRAVIPTRPGACDTKPDR